MKIIFLGAPGAGKGTQAEKVADALGIPTVSTGAIIRAAVQNATTMGKKAKKFIDQGDLVPDDVVIEIIKERLNESDCDKGYILDGFPRTVPQAQALDAMGIEIDRVISLEVADEAIIERMSGRRVCIFRSFSLIQPIFLRISPKDQVKTAGKIKQISTSPIQSMAVMAVFVPAATSATQPE